VALGNIGSMLAGLAALLVAVVTLPQIPGGVRDWRARQREQAALAADQRKQIELDRRARLHGWSPGGVATYGVTLVTEPGELERAAAELGGYSDYVILRVSEGPGSATARSSSGRPSSMRASSRGRPRRASGRPSRPGSTAWAYRTLALAGRLRRRWRSPDDPDAPLRPVLVEASG
jgi:hypothetical protein